MIQAWLLLCFQPLFFSHPARITMTNGNIKSSDRVALAGSFLAGIAISTIFFTWKTRKVQQQRSRKWCVNRINLHVTLLCSFRPWCFKPSSHYYHWHGAWFFCTAGATMEGHDLSLFYGDISQLTTTSPSQKFLADSIYAQLVRDCVICCVDILLVRISSDRNKTVSIGREGIWACKGRLVAARRTIAQGRNILWCRYDDTVCFCFVLRYCMHAWYWLESIHQLQCI